MLIAGFVVLDGLDVNARGADGRTLLSWAAQRGQLNTILYLLRLGADPNARDWAGRTPLRGEPV
jgi:ankyrin repeat protein